MATRIVKHPASFQERSKSTLKNSEQATYRMTRLEFEECIRTLEVSSRGFVALIEDAAGYAGAGRYESCSPDKAALYPFIECRDKLKQLAHDLQQRFAAREKELRDDPDSDYYSMEISITGTDVALFKEAIAPACAFIQLLNGSAGKGGGLPIELLDEVAVNTAEAATVFMHHALKVVLPMLESRLKESQEGGAA
jgi:hypothetical protein